MKAAIIHDFGKPLSIEEAVGVADNPHLDDGSPPMAGARRRRTLRA